MMASTWGMPRGGVHDQPVVPAPFGPCTVGKDADAVFSTTSRLPLLPSVSASLNGFQQGSVSGLTDHVEDP